jgi:1-aminocyclopropane-1-carboxylate deaminase
MVSTIDEALDPGLADVQVVRLPLLDEQQISMDVLRLDKIHSLISGNKWFKLKYSLQNALSAGFDEVVTFGGAYSNHILATAAACRITGLRSVGVIRGEQPPQLSCTLKAAMEQGMQMNFVSRNLFSQKENLYENIRSTYKDSYVIEEGGRNDNGIRGAGEILRLAESAKYQYICCALGTGTMLAGIAKNLDKHQRVLAISSLKTSGVQNELQIFLKEKNIPADQYEINYDYHFGGYARHPPALLDFMNDFYSTASIPTDFVYTAKLFYAILDLIRKSYFPQRSSILVIHSGGLQGNCSLPKGRLLF